MLLIKYINKSILMYIFFEFIKIQTLVWAVYIDSKNNWFILCIS